MLFALSSFVILSLTLCASPGREKFREVDGNYGLPWILHTTMGIVPDTISDVLMPPHAAIPARSRNL